MRIRPILLAAAVLFGPSAAAADSAKMSFSYQAQPSEKAPRRTQIILQVEGFYHNGESGLMGTDEVIPGFPKTYFEEVVPVGGGVVFRRLLTPLGNAAFIAGVRYVPMSLTLQELGEVFGTLEVKPWIGYLGIEFAIGHSPNGNGNFLSLEAGAGPAQVSWTNGPALRALGDPYGISYDIAVKNAVIIEADVMMRTILGPIVLTVGGGYFHVPGGVKTVWSASGPGGNLVLSDLDHMVVSGIKIGGGIGFKFGL